jgi:hypothetical protein
MSAERLILLLLMLVTLPACIFERGDEEKATVPTQVPAYVPKNTDLDHQQLLEELEMLRRKRADEPAVGQFPSYEDSKGWVIHFRLIATNRSTRIWTAKKMNLP